MSGQWQPTAYKMPLVLPQGRLLGIWPPLFLLHLMHSFISGSNKGELHGEFKSSIAVFLQCCEFLDFYHQALEIIKRHLVRHVLVPETDSYSLDLVGYLRKKRGFFFFFLENSSLGKKSFL